jgi:hypothetical protein
MNDLLNEIFKKYGLLTILFAIVFALIIWGVTHWMASPGKEVSVLWGLARYTKTAQSTIVSDTAEMKELTKLTSSPTSNQEINDTVILPSISLYVQNGVTASVYEKELSKIRNQRHLRELEALESGKMVSDLPTGTFFFITVDYISSRTYESTKTRVFESEAYRFSPPQPKIRMWLELQNTVDDGLQVIGFLSEVDAAKISLLSGQEIHSIVLSPYPWGQLTTLVSIPLQRIQSSNYRYIEPNQAEVYIVLDITIK